MPFNHVFPDVPVNNLFEVTNDKLFLSGEINFYKRYLEIQHLWLKVLISNFET